MKVLAVVLLVLASTFAHGEMNEGIDARDIIESNVSCSSLSSDELEAIGEYYMEQMHPGQQHVMMDNMMGGEGSESLKEAHITMAQRIYCGQDVPSPLEGRFGGNMASEMPLGLASPILMAVGLGSAIIGLIFLLKR